MVFAAEPSGENAVQWNACLNVGAHVFEATPPPRT